MAMFQDGASPSQPYQQGGQPQYGSPQQMTQQAGSQEQAPGVQTPGPQSAETPLGMATPEQLETQVLGMAYSRHPYLGEYEVTLEWKNQLPERGYFVGQLLVSHQQSAPQHPHRLAGAVENQDMRQRESGGEPVIRIPVLVVKFKPLEMVTFLDPQKRTMPLNEYRVRSAMQQFAMTQPGVPQASFPQTVSTSAALTQMGAGPEASLQPAGVIGDLKTAEVLSIPAPTPEQMANEGIPSPPKVSQLPKPQQQMPEGGGIMDAGMTAPPEGARGALVQGMQDPGVQSEVLKNEALRQAAMRVLALNPETDEIAAEVILSGMGNPYPDVVQLDVGPMGLSGGVQEKTACAACYAPRMRMLTYSQYLKEYPRSFDDHLIKRGGLLLVNPVSGDHEQEKTASALISDLEKTGMVAVRDPGGPDKLASIRQGLLVPEVVDTNNRVTGQRLVLLEGTGDFALQTKVAGLPLRESEEHHSVLHVRMGRPGGYGCFLYEKGASGQELVATEPMQLSKVATIEAGDPDRTVWYRASVLPPVGTKERALGSPRSVKLAQVPHIDQMVWADPSTLLVPEDWQWTSLDKRASLSNEVNQERAIARPSGETDLYVQGVGENRFMFSGKAAAAAGAGPHRRGEATFILGCMGIPTKTASQLLSQAKVGAGPVHARAGRALIPERDAVKTASREYLELAQWIRKINPGFLLKEASRIGSVETIDAVMGLGLMSPGNIAHYINQSNKLEDAVQTLAGMALASQMGAIEGMSPEMLTGTMKSVERVIQALRALRASVAAEGI